MEKEFKRKVKIVIAQQKNQTQLKEIVKCKKTIAYINQLKAPKMKKPDYKDLYNRTSCVVYRNCNKFWPYFVNITLDIFEDIRKRHIKKPKIYPPKCYIEKGNINYKKFIQDELFFIDYLVLNRSINSVSIFFFN